MIVQSRASTSATLFLLSAFAITGICCRVNAQTPTEAPSTPVAAADYSQLTRPEVADAVKLTDEQKTSIQALSTARDAATAAAEAAARPAIVSASNEQLKSVLTADQQRLFVSLFSGTTLRFNFRNQKWAEVLDWISKEADLSLVMETPPPGVFTYSDSKDYTTTESIDLLNGWLLTKGFTLVRRERMLMCLDLKSGLPEGAIPRVTLAELPTRGRYEFVSVLIPLEGRPAEAVLLEVKPLLGSYGKAEPLAQTQQLLVFDTTASLRVIEQIVQKVPIPQKPVVPPIVEPPKPILTVYPIEHANPLQAGEVLKTIVAGTVVIDEKARQISVNAIPTEQEKAKIIIGQLESNQGPDMQPKLQLYSVQVSDAQQMLATLKLIAPEGQYRIDPVSGKLIAWASKKDQAQIAESLQMIQAEQPPDGGRQLQVYALKNAEPTAVSTILLTVVPTARVTVNTTTRSLIAFGTLADHEAIRALIEQLEEQTETAAAEKVLKSCPLQPKVTSATIIALLASLVPKASVTPDEVNRRLLITATEKEHALIDRVIAQVQQEAVGVQPELKFYDVATIGATDAKALLATTYVDVTFVATAEGNKLMAWVSVVQDERIRATLEQLATERPFATTRTMELYSIADLGPTASTVFAQAVPRATITAGAQADQLAIVATAADHEQLKKVLAQLQGAKSVAPAKELAIFRLNQLDGLAVQQALQPLLPKTANVTADRIGRQLFVSASAEDMPAIREMVQQMISSPGTAAGLETRSYRLRPFEADEAQEVLARLFPDATMVTDTSEELLVATATPEQHETINKVVQQMTMAAPVQNGPLARAYPLRAADGANAVEVFDAMFRRTDNVRVSFDAKTRSLIAVARPDQHETIKALIEQLEPGDRVDHVRAVEIYALPGMDGLTAVQVAEGVLQSIDPAATVSWEKTSKQLIVSTTAAGQQEVSRTFARFQESDPREMDVIQLRMLSASSAQNAIEGLYGDNFTRDGDYPVIQADEDSQQLLVRGSKKQLQDIRTLLIRMGESSLTVTGGLGEQANRNLRVILIQGDVESTLQKIQDLWPRVRRNPIRILRPDGEAQPAAPGSKGEGEFSVPAESPNTDEAAAARTPTAEKTETLQKPAPLALAAALQPITSDEPPAVIIIPGSDRITIASDDADALDQLESILRATSSRSSGAAGNRNRDFSVYQLRNAGAEDVAETLESIYESRAGTLAFGSVVIVPETRMNALIVYGGRTDRDRIEQLLEILDTEKLPDSGRIFRTQVLPVKHADAKKVETVLRGVYRTEMTAGGSRRAIEIPAGIDSSVANVLRQINAASSAPLLTIEVQIETNSLVVKAPQNLIDELTELVTQLDETSATNRARGVTLIPLRQTNSRRVMRILDDVLD